MHPVRHTERKTAVFGQIIADYCKTHFNFFIGIEVFDQMSWNLVCRFLSCAWIWNRRHFGFRGARNYAKLNYAVTFAYINQMSWNLVCRFLSCAWIWNRRHFGFRGARNYAKLNYAVTFAYINQMSWNLVCRFLSCAWIWNQRHFGFRGARSYAKLILAITLTKWAEIWYVGSLAVPEYGTDAILDFEGQEATLNSF